MSFGSWVVSSWLARVKALPVLAGVLVFFLAVDRLSQAALADEAKRVDEFLVVDCLLPGQIRQLGTRVTYVSARKAVKTSAGDCEIRGGEYVAYDRASYGSALKVWLPLAEKGITKAQTYVGEVFEKGLGLPPDYEAAALWYQAAAQGGSSRAAINLGNLYEKGLGVEKNPAEALRWYRRASGLPDLNFEISSPSQQTQELERLRTEVGKLRHELAAKQTELERSQQQLDELRLQFEQRRGEAQAERSELRRLRQELAERRQAAKALIDPVELERVTAVLREREAELERRHEEMSVLKRDIQAMRDESKSLRQVADQSAKQTAAERTKLADLKAEILRRSAEFERLQTANEKSQRARSEAQRNLRGRKEQEAETARALQALEKDIQDRENRLEEKDQKITDLLSSLSRLETQLSEQRAEIKRLEESAPRIEIIEPELSSTRGASPGALAVTLRSPQEKLLVIGRIRAPENLFSLTVNGQEQPLEANGLFRAKVPLAGHGDQITVVAIDKDGKRTSLEFDVLGTNVAKEEPRSRTATKVGFRLPDGSVRFGKYHALVIGNDNYRLLPQLKTAVRDAQTVSSILQKEYGFRVTTLLDATRYDILSALNTLRKQLSDEDNLLVYYAGHGELDRVNQRGNWLPVDAEPTSTANWIPNVAITDILNAMSVRQLLVVADSCYSGTLTRSIIGMLQAGLSDAKRIKLLQTMVQQRSRMALTSGGLEPVLDSAGGKHSVFAQSLIDVLQRNVGVLAGQELFQVVLPRVVDAANRSNVRQVPEYAPIKYAGHESGDFFFVRRTN